ncbi:MAG: LysE family transporter [Polyangiaceae bacterium]|jgi:threonine/homoserine/homoserine lactone efflux protein
MLWLAVCAIAMAFGYVGSMPLAGPIAVLMLSRAADRRFGEALRIGLGAALAEGIYAGVAFWGFTTFLARHEFVVPLSRGATMLLLPGIGIWFLFWRPRESAAADAQQPRAGTTLLGFSISALNPTLFVTWSAAVAFLYSKGLGGQPPLVAIPFGVCASAGVAAWITCLVALLRRTEGRLPRAVIIWVVRAMALTLIGLGLWSGVQLIRWTLEPRKRAGDGSVSLSCGTWLTKGSPRRDAPPSRSSRIGPTTSA